MHKWFHVGNVIIAIMMAVFIVGSYSTLSPFQLNPMWSIAGMPIVFFWAVVWILYSFIVGPLVLKMTHE